MNQLDYTIANSNNIVVKTRLESIIDKMNKQDKPNELLLSQFTGSRFIGLTSSCSYSLSKNRLKMLTMMKSKNISKN